MPSEAIPNTQSGVRQRLFDALEQSVVEHGLQGTTITEIVRRAATSRRTFYEHFESKEACYLEFLAEVNKSFGQRIKESVDPSAHPFEQVRQGVRAWLGAVEDHPGLHASVIRELPSLGQLGRQLLRSNHENLIAIFQELTANPQLRDLGIMPISRERALVLLGGIYELVTTTFEDGGKPTDVEATAIEAVYALLGPQVEIPGF